MTKSMLDMVALVFERIARLMLDAPPRSPAPHALIPGAFGHAEVGDPATVLDLVPVPLPALQAVDAAVHIGLIERPITDTPKPMAQTCLGVIPLIIRATPSVLGRRDVREAGRMVPFCDTQNIMEGVSVQQLDMGSVRTQAVFGDDPLEVGGAWRSCVRTRLAALRSPSFCVEGHNQPVQESESGTPLKALGHIGTDVEGVMPQAPSLQRGAGDLALFGGLTLGDALGSQLPVLRKEVRTFESIPAWLAVREALLRVLDAGSHSDLLCQSLAC